MIYLGAVWQAPPKAKSIKQPISGIHPFKLSPQSQILNSYAKPQRTERNGAPGQLFQAVPWAVLESQDYGQQSGKFARLTGP